MKEFTGEKFKRWNKIINATNKYIKLKKRKADSIKTEIRMRQQERAAGKSHDFSAGFFKMLGQSFYINETLIEISEMNVRLELGLDAGTNKIKI